MKKRICLILICLALAVCSLTGCGAEMKDSAYLGTWTATTVEYAGVELDVAETLGGEWTFVLNEDATCDMTISGETQSGTWTEIVEGFCVEETFNFYVYGEEASMDYEGMHINFTRQATK